jgi:CMP-N-acetylneuraminic acid synthetase
MLFAFTMIIKKKRMKIVAIVPVKLNNERLPGKNTKLLGNTPLIQYILNTLLQVHNIEEIFVYCSDASIKSYLPSEVKFLRRDQSLDLPTSNFNRIFESFLTVVNAEIYVYAHATAPFITPETVHDCLTHVESGNYDSAFTASEIQDYLWFEGKPLNFDATNLPRSQDLPPIYRETSGIYVFTKKQYLQTHRRIGNKPYIKNVSPKEAIDINTFEDFELAQMIIKNI